MNVFTSHLNSVIEEVPTPDFPKENVDLVLVHGSRYSIEDPILLEKLTRSFPNAVISGGSTTGEIENGNLHSNSIVFAALDFESTEVRQTRVTPTEGDSHFGSGKALAEQMDAEDLKLLLVFSDGMSIDCDELMGGINECFGARQIPVFGGLAGDSMEWLRTLVLDNDGAHQGSILGVGLYGESLEVRSSTSAFDFQGWDRQVTRSDGNLVYELNGRRAYDVFREAIDPESEGKVGANSINYPLLVLTDEGEPLVCRTPIRAEEENGTLMFAGSVPEGPARVLDMSDPAMFIKDAATVAKNVSHADAEFAFVVNCGARRAVLGAYAEVIEAREIQDRIGNDIPSIGFYSYGEFGNNRITNEPELHNQTVSILSLNEA